MTNLEEPQGSCLCCEEKTSHDGTILSWLSIHYACLQHINRLGGSGSHEALRSEQVRNA